MSLLYKIWYVLINLKKQQGSGIMDTLLKPFTFERYKNERHAINENGIPYNWMGPFTSIKDRTNPDGTYKESSTPISKGDYESYIHDKTYYNAKEDYYKNPTPENRKTQLQIVWNADDKFGTWNV